MEPQLFILAQSEEFIYMSLVVIPTIQQSQILVVGYSNLLEYALDPERQIVGLSINKRSEKGKSQIQKKHISSRIAPMYIEFFFPQSTRTIATSLQDSSAKFILLPLCKNTRLLEEGTLVEEQIQRSYLDTHRPAAMVLLSALRKSFYIHPPVQSGHLYATLRSSQFVACIKTCLFSSTGKSTLQYIRHSYGRQSRLLAFLQSDTSYRVLK